MIPIKVPTTSPFNSLERNVYKKGLRQASAEEANGYINDLLSCWSYALMEKVAKKMKENNIDPSSVVMNCDSELLNKRASFPKGVAGVNFLNSYFSIYFRLFNINDKALKYLMKKSDVQKNFSLYILFSSAYMARQTAIISQSSMTYLIDNSHYTKEQIAILYDKVIGIAEGPLNKDGARNLIAVYFNSFDYLRLSKNNILTQEQIGKLIDMSDINIQSKYEISALFAMRNVFDYLDISQKNIEKIVSKLTFTTKQAREKFTASAVGLLYGKSPKVIDLLDTIDKIHSIDWLSLALNNKKKLSQFHRFLPHISQESQEAVILNKRIVVTDKIREALMCSEHGQVILEKRQLSDELESMGQIKLKKESNKI